MAAEPKPSESDPNVEAYNQQRARLEAEHPGCVRVLQGRKLGRIDR